MYGDITPLPNTPSRRGAQLKHRVNFIFHSRTILLIVKKMVINCVARMCREADGAMTESEVEEINS
jgi:hypothetical protein